MFFVVTGAFIFVNCEIEWSTNNKSKERRLYFNCPVYDLVVFIYTKFQHLRSVTVLKLSVEKNAGILFQSIQLCKLYKHFITTCLFTGKA